MKINNFIMVLILMLYGAVALLTICLNIAYEEIDSKLENIAAQADATSQKVESLETDFKTYETSTKEVIDNICEYLEIHKENNAKMSSDSTQADIVTDGSNKE